MNISFSPNVAATTAPKPLYCANPAQVSIKPDIKDTIDGLKNSDKFKKIADNVKKIFYTVKDALTKNGVIKKVRDFVKNTYEKVAKNENFKKVIDTTVNLYKKAKESPVIAKIIKFAKNIFKKAKPVA